MRFDTEIGGITPDAVSHDLPGTWRIRLVDPTGVAPSFDRQFTAIYKELRKIASAMLRGVSPNTLLNPTALVNEAYLKLAVREEFSSESPLHLKRTIIRVMRQLLIDSIRHKQSEKGGGGAARVTLDDDVQQQSWSIEDLIVAGDLIDKLRAIKPRYADTVECRFFFGLTAEETAEALGTSRATVERDWTIARAWLTGQMS